MILEQNRQYQFKYQISRSVIIARNTPFVLNRMLSDITIKNIRFTRNRLILIIEANTSINSDDVDNNLQDALFRHFKIKNIVLVNITEHRRLFAPLAIFDRVGEAGRTIYRDVTWNFRLVVIAIMVVGIGYIYTMHKK